MTRALAVVELVARALADHPEAITVVEREHRATTVIELSMAPSDLGRVIGRSGRTAAAIRTLAAAAAEAEGRKIVVEFREKSPRR
jgi:predicted RNA-binding protein YlqC (UPF0109 family)